MNTQINYASDQLDYANISGILPAGREIPSMHTHDLQGARPKAATLERHIWQDQYVPQQIQNQPGYKAHQESLGKKMRNPLFVDYYYQKYDEQRNNQSSLAQPPEINPRATNLIKVAQNQFPSQQYNSDLQNYLIEQGNKARQQQSSSNNVYNKIKQQSIDKHQEEIGKNKSPFVMHIDPGKTTQKSHPFSYIQNDSIDESKSILRGDATLSASNAINFPQAQSVRDYFSPKSNQVQNGQRILNSNNNDSFRSASGMINNNSQYQMQNYDIDNYKRSNFSQKPISKSVSHLKQVIQNKNNYNEGNNRYLQQPQQIDDHYKEQNQQSQYISQQQQQQQYSQLQQQAPAAPRPNSDIQNQQNNNPFSSKDKVYKPYNVITNRIHNQYQPKYNVKVNQWDCYDKPQWKDYQAKQQAPVNILKEKNRNNIDTSDFSTQNYEYGLQKQKYRV